MGAQIERSRCAISDGILTEHCSICVKTLSEIELGNANPILEVMQKIAAYIGAAPYEMLMPEPDRNGETDNEDSLHTVSP